MDSESLHTDLQNLLAYKDSRVRIGTYCVKEDLLPELIQLCQPESGVSHQACWSLEQSYLLFEADCYLHLGEICALFPMKINHSAMRSLLKIGTLLCKSYYSKREHPIKEILTLEMRNQLVEGAFNELLTAYGKTANLAFATNTLFLLGTEFDWIHPAMPAIIEEHIVNPESKGYKSVGGKTLKRLND
ncbi:adenylosuccinate lyase [Nonlabens antarcticus]|uniref:adenylosuccinate lyase n=1 Tax=Nonlabens antarcticus TaxID=392714 RepID=UPI0018913287|nr:adenylosuccinate lyase [Nonlabens antarcticus]